MVVVLSARERIYKLGKTEGKAGLDRIHVFWLGLYTGVLTGTMCLCVFWLGPGMYSDWDPVPVFSAWKETIHQGFSFWTRMVPRGTATRHVSVGLPALGWSRPPHLAVSFTCKVDTIMSALLSPAASTERVTQKPLELEPCCQLIWAMIIY